MSRRRIQVTIAADGSLTVEAIGFKGRGCLRATAPLTEALGATITTTPKPEIHQTPCQTTRQQPLGRPPTS